jgi:hypothetical protein
MIVSELIELLRTFPQDAELDCPLIYNPEISDRPFVDWVIVKEMFKSIGIIQEFNRYSR